METLSESDETRVDVSDAVAAVAKALPSKTMVGLAAVAALADEGIAIRLAITKSPVRTIEIALRDADIALEFKTVDIRLPSLVHLFLLDVNSKPRTFHRYLATGCG